MKKDEIFFDDSIEGFGAKTKVTPGDSIHIPKACFSCDGQSWGGYGCFQEYCPIFDFSLYQTERKRNRSTLRS